MDKGLEKKRKQKYLFMGIRIFFKIIIHRKFIFAACLKKLN